MIFFRKLFWKKAQKKLLSRLVNSVASQDNFDVSNTLLIAGSARSGTTFVMESINHNNEYRILFEPFVAEYTPEWHDDKSRSYFDIEDITDLERQSIEDVLSGKISNPWVDGHNMKMKSTKRIVKAIRANLILPAIRFLYPNLPILYITRDIREVVQSRLKMGFDDELDVLLSYKNFLAKYYPSLDVSAAIATIKTKAGRHAFLWLLENRFLIENVDTFSLHHLDYADIRGKSVRYEGGSFIIVEEKSRASASTSSEKPYLLSQEEIDDIERIKRYF